MQRTMSCLSEGCNPCGKPCATCSGLANAGKKPHGERVSRSAFQTESSSELPWQAGWRAAKANFRPALVVQATMALLLLAYHHHDASREWLDRLASFRMRTGFLYSSISAMVAAAVIPELLRLFFFQSGRLQRSNITNLAFTMPFWGLICITVDLFYRQQAQWFGDGTDLLTLATKVSVDQFGYTAFFATPMTCILYDWKHNGFRLRGMRQAFTWRYYHRVIFPVLFTNWCVWIPMITVIYCLPLPLQIPMFSLALSMWVLLYTWMSEKRQEAESG